MKVVITGSDGFIAKNLSCRLREDKRYTVCEINRDTPSKTVAEQLADADFVFHLAGINRPDDISEFWRGNTDFTERVVKVLAQTGRKIPIMLSSSSQATLDNPYGRSKLAAEKLVQEYATISGADHYIYRLPNVFGKWCKPNYNSFVATFCNNIVHGKEILIDDPSSQVDLVYVDDVCDDLSCLLLDHSIPKPKPKPKPKLKFFSVPIQYETTVGEVARILYRFKTSQQTLILENVGFGLERALYATFLSYFPPVDFKYEIPTYKDERGIFCEMLKTRSTGQFSYFTAGPGVTRGGHYHHSKNEKFLVIKGQARFKFKNILTGERYSVSADAQLPEIVVTVPGWCHDITNIGDEELIVMLWANEIFDRDRPDTFAQDLF